MTIMEPIDGANPADNLICPRCESSLPLHAKFCSACGERIDKKRNEEGEAHAANGNYDAHEQEVDTIARLPSLSRADVEGLQSDRSLKNNGITGQTHKSRVLSLAYRVRNDSLLRNSIYIMATNVVTALFGYIFWLVATHIYSTYDVGLGAAFLSVMALASTLATLGIDSTLVLVLPRGEAGHVNLASLMLMHPQLDVDALLARLEAPVFGIDLHWMSHCHGSIEVAKRVKAIHPEALVIFGGISSTYYADQLIQYPAVDVVVKGYDTLEPVTLLMQAVKRGERTFSHIPNLLYKHNGSEVTDTGFTHKPMKNYNDVAIDWSHYREAKDVSSRSKLIMTLPNTGCAYDCPFCGGSRYATNKIMGIKKTLVTKDNQRVIHELQSLGDAARMTSIYALQCYSETEVILAYSSDQIMPLPRPFGGRWYDDFTVPASMINELVAR